jgi:hypothetical protein
VYCEILQGIRDEEIYQRTRLSLRAYPILRPRWLETFEAAANLYRTARRRGFGIPVALARQRDGASGQSPRVRIKASAFDVCTTPGRIQ